MNFDVYANLDDEPDFAQPDPWDSDDVDARMEDMGYIWDDYEGYIPNEDGD